MPLEMGQRKAKAKVKQEQKEKNPKKRGRILAAKIPYIEMVPVEIM